MLGCCYSKGHLILITTRIFSLAIVLSVVDCLGDSQNNNTSGRSVSAFRVGGWNRLGLEALRQGNQQIVEMVGSSQTNSASLATAEMLRMADMYLI